MKKGERLFAKLCGYNPKDIEPPLSGPEIWRAIAHKRHQPTSTQFPQVNSSSEQYVTRYSTVENHSKEKDPYYIIERVMSDGEKQIAFVTGRFNTGPEKIAPYLDEALWFPEE